MDEDTFFLVWNPEGRAPTRKHETLDIAIGEARRLASLNQNQKFYVLRAVKRAEAVTVKVSDLRDGYDDEIAF
jgi:hypothetical protein